MTTCDQIAKRLEEEWLYPVIDRAMDLVRAECPECWTGSIDPLGMYRPLIAMPHDGRVIVVCDVCGEASDV